MNLVFCSEDVNVRHLHEGSLQLFSALFNRRSVPRMLLHFAHPIQQRFAVGFLSDLSVRHFHHCKRVHLLLTPKGRKREVQRQAEDRTAE